MTSKYRFTLDTHSAQSQTSIPVLLGDTNRTLYISFTDGGNPYHIETGCLAKLSIKRPTGTHIEEFCEIQNNTTVVYPFSQNENTCAVAGIHDCDVTLTDLDGQVLTSPRFSMIVSERVINSDDINLTDDDKSAVDAMIEAEVSRQAAETGRVNAEADRVTAEDERVAAETARATAVNDVLEDANEALETANKAITATREATTAANAAAASVVSPTVTVTTISGGHRVSITDKTGTKTFDVMDGENGLTPSSTEPILTEVTLLAANWVGTESPYSQVVSIDGADERSKIDLQPSVEQLAIFHEKDIAFVVENEDGEITVYVIGDKPTNDYTIQATITEVSV